MIWRKIFFVSPYMELFTWYLGKNDFSNTMMYNEPVGGGFSLIASFLAEYQNRKGRKIMQISKKSSQSYCKFLSSDSNIIFNLSHKFTDFSKVLDIHMIWVKAFTWISGDIRSPVVWYDLKRNFYHFTLHWITYMIFGQKWFLKHADARWTRRWRIFPDCSISGKVPELQRSQ